MKVMKTKIRLIFLASTAGIITACNNNNQPPATPQADQSITQQAADSAAKARDEFLATMDKKMAELDAKINDLSTKAANATGDAKANTDRALADLRFERDAVRKQYDELKASGQEGWDKTKATFQSAWDSLVKALRP